MDISKTTAVRRMVVAAGLIASLALGGACAALAAKAHSASANAAVVKAFIDSWADPDKSVTYLAADAKLTMIEDKPPVIGPDGYMSVIKPFMSGGSSFSGQILSTFAKGPVVVDSRIDTVKSPGKPDQPIKVVGVFILRDGKIEQWTDYVYK